MSKRRKHEIPDFSSRKPAANPSKDSPRDGKHLPAPQPRVKPQATSSKSGRRGQ